MWIGYSLQKESWTPAIDAGAYTANDNIGGLWSMTFGRPVLREGGSGFIVGAVLSDKAAQIGTHAIEAYIFEANPSGSTFTNNAAFAIADADINKCCGVISFTSAANAQIGSSSGNEVIRTSELWVPYSLESQESQLYIAMKIKGAATFTSTSDLTLKLYMVRN